VGWQVALAQARRAAPFLERAITALVSIRSKIIADLTGAVTMISADWPCAAMVNDKVIIPVKKRHLILMLFVVLVLSGYYGNERQLKGSIIYRLHVSNDTSRTQCAFAVVTHHKIYAKKATL
jgi:hypothetical protein